MCIFEVYIYEGRVCEISFQHVQVCAERVREEKAAHCIYIMIDYKYEPNLTGIRTGRHIDT